MYVCSLGAARIWDVDLIERQGPGTLVRVAKEGRLLRLSAGLSTRLEIHWMDEATLALVDAAISPVLWKSMPKAR